MNILDNNEINNRVDQSIEIINRAIDQYNPSHVFALFSGGHDSLCSTHIASQIKGFNAVIHINTGIGIEETREFVRDTCLENKWPLYEYHPPVSYEDLVIEHGFPGPAMHYKMYQRLKERCLWAVLRDFGTRSRKVLFVSGRRKDESIRRMANCKDEIQEGPYPSKRVIWVNPIMSWDSNDKNKYIALKDLKKNAVVERLCMSGECLCGAFAHKNELNEVRFFYPEAAREIDRISEKVKSNGQHHQWGCRPKKPTDKNQTLLPLCSSCVSKYENGLNYERNQSTT